MHGALAPAVQRLDPNRGPLFVENSVVQIVIEVAVALEQSEALGIAVCENAFVMTCGGLTIGRQMRSPLPVKIAKPSLSWISGRQSRGSWRVSSPYQNMLEKGAMPMWSMSGRGMCSRNSISISTRKAGPLGLHHTLCLHAIGTGEAWPIEQRVYDRIIPPSGSGEASSQ